MKKQIIDKCIFFLDPLLDRIFGNRDFFEGIDVDYREGLKRFSFPVSLENDRLTFIYSGERFALTAAEFEDFLLREFTRCDEFTVYVHERGNDAILFCDAKDVKLSNKAAKGSSRAVENASAEEGGVHGGNGPGSGAYGGATLGNREYVIKAGPASGLLKAIGIMSKDGKIKNDRIRKYNQIDHFVELLVPMLKEASDRKGGAPLRVIDCGCGKSYLSFVLNYYVKEVLGKKCYFTGLDFNSVVIEDSKKTAAELGYRNMDFIRTDIGAFEPEEQYDLLMTLHACDTATDKALNFAVRCGIPNIVCVPCCHKEMNETYSLPGFEPLMKYGVFKAAVAASLTDALRCNYLEAMGYDVSAVEYISPLDTPKNIMIRATRASDGIDAVKLMEHAAMVKRLGTSLSIGK